MNITNHEKAKEFFSELGHNDNGITSIVEFGTRRASKLSDIDIMIIIESDDTILTTPKWMQFTSYPNDVKHALDGGAVKIVTEKQFSHLPILGAMNVNKIYGPLINQISFDETLRTLIAIVDVMDWLAERIVTLQGHIDSNGVHATRAINCAYSIVHTFNRAVIAGAITEKDAFDYQKEIDLFRSQWQQSPKSLKSNLLPWLDDQLNAAKTLSIQFSNFAKTQNYYSPPNDAEQSCFRFNNGVLRFTNNGRSLQNRTIPGIWLTHLAYQAQLKGTIPNEINSRTQRGNSHSELKLETELRKLIASRMKLCNSMADMLLPLGMKDNIYRFGHLLAR